MAFSEAEMAVLAQLAYLNVSVPEGDPLDLGEFLKRKTTLDYLDSKFGDTYKNTISKLIEKVENSNYKIVKATNEKDGSGFSALAIQDPNNEITVACRGTEGFNVFDSDDSRRDVYTDLQIATEVETNQQKDLEKFLNELEQQGNYDGYYFTGHSLGGNLATHGAIYMAKSGKVKGVKTYNAPGFNAAYHARHAIEIALIAGLITNYQNEYDYVSSCFNPLGNVVIVESDVSGWHFGFKHHDIGSMKIDENDHFVYNKGGKSIRTQVVKGVTGLINSMWFGVATMELFVTCSRAIPTIVNNIKEWCFKQTPGYKYATANSYININTTTMRTYASQLQSLSSRSKNLDRRMNSLYWQLGINWNSIINLARLLKAEVVLDYASRLDKCVNYLNQTAGDFEQAEREIQNMVG